ncbi:RluA family pseudouridine synthase [Paraburkholderia caballeronis]|uniref:Pseudouridine synthase n=1 Tax=Paraburkholderia caballeronis TaxID=416943 RepID=A0A1H7JM84_9BURK|nr:RluA family pseudouridine synthase [Paraburkholderia caballeronis]PXW27368.1 ribosomal large subunit pseudouridine synthase D [Paraburkholderia caballeronis]PXX02842.1 ribosomal large subunit pseudouridine synthase D [Paraburkholderia caballeronis]RAK03567.1 ribosomal large subunit pseudouridine synthase D [Paraburkholderia caballeronis]SEC33083.1 ribosomal large subunit pseudouridine synthase D [Paraburkholderia caballeronis]SEK75514.1 ribosomal large subunit pseudouridine synthase D [Para
MTRSVLPGAGAAGAQNSNSDYSLAASRDDAAAGDGFDDDLTGDALAASPAAASRGAGDDEAPRRASVPDELAGERLDKVLAKVFPEFSRSRLQGWIEAGRVQVDGAPAKVRQPVPLGATIELVPDLLPEQLAFTPEPVPLDVVYEDDALVVIDKPAGLVVHPAAGNWSGTILNGLLHRYGDAAAGLPRAGIVHRLDKETSGLMVVARTLEAQTDLVRQLQARTVKRRYLALVWGMMPDEGTIDAPIGRDSRDRTRMAVVAGASGKPARTHFRRVDSTLWHGQPVSAIHCDLETGRTHQIRVHCAHIGHPLLGDPVYGRARGKRSVAALPGGFARQALHAWRLGLIHPRTGRAMQWRADAPDDIAELIAALGFGNDDAEYEFDDDEDLYDGEYDDADHDND